jgi:F-box protein 11
MRIREFEKGLRLAGRTGSTLVAALALACGNRSTPSPSVRIEGAPQGQVHASIADALREAAPGARITVGPGTHRENLVIDKEIEIVAEGAPGSAVIEAASGSVIHLENCNATLRGFEIRSLGAVYDTNTEWGAVRIASGQPRLEDCRVTSMAYPAVAVTGMETNPSLVRCMVHSGNNSGVMIWRQGTVTMEECDVNQSHDLGILITERGRCFARRCDIHDNLKDGVWFSADSSGVIEDCEIHANLHSGVLIDSGSDPIIQNCRIHDCGTAGVFVPNGGRGTVVDCEIHDQPLPDVVVEAGSDLTVRRCRISASQNEGVELRPSATATLEGCEIFENAQDGVGMDTFARATVIDCDLHDNGGMNLFLRDRNTVLVTHSRFRSARMSGIHISSFSTGPFQDCEIEGNRWHGVALDGYAAPRFTNCRISNSGWSGVRPAGLASGEFVRCDIAESRSANVIAGYATTTFRECRIHDGEQSGVDAYGENRSVFQDCEIFDNAWSGVATRLSANPRFERCRVHGNARFAVRAFDGGGGLFLDCDLTGNRGDSWSVEEGSWVEPRGCQVSPSTSAPTPRREEPGTFIVSASRGGDFRSIVEAYQCVPAGSTLRVRPGTYRTGLQIRKPLTIEGDGPREEIIVESDRTNALEAIAGGVTLRGLTLRTAIESGLQFSGVAVMMGGQAVVEDCDVTANTGAAVAVQQGSRAEFRACRLHDAAGCGAYISENSAATLDRCEITDNASAGVSADAGASATVRQCQIHRNREWGVWVLRNSRGSVDGCDLRDNAPGAVNVEPGSQLQQSGNQQ